MKIETGKEAREFFISVMNLYPDQAKKAKNNWLNLLDRELAICENEDRIEEIIKECRILSPNHLEKANLKAIEHASNIELAYKVYRGIVNDNNKAGLIELLTKKVKSKKNLRFLAKRIQDKEIMIKILYEKPVSWVIEN